DKFLEIQYEVERLTVKKAHSVGSVSANDEPTKVKLPVLKLKTFSGDIKEFLGFWASFAHIHESAELSDATKLAYLTNAMEQGSEARRVVETFPALGKNYQKVVARLKQRYGRENTLVQVYVRELLALVISNASKNRPVDISTLYDQIETQLQALE